MTHQIQFETGYKILLEHTRDALLVIYASAKSCRAVAASASALKLLGASCERQGHCAQMELFLECCEFTNAQNEFLWRNSAGDFHKVQVQPMKGEQDGFHLVRLQIQEGNSAELKLKALTPLSRREAEVYFHMERGLSNSEIAREMALSYDTIRTYVRNIFVKLKVSSRVEAINVIRTERLRPRTDSRGTENTLAS